MSAAAGLGFSNSSPVTGPKIFNEWTTGNGTSVFTMTATTATDPSVVEYLFTETLTGRALIGCALILAGVLIVQLAPMSKGRVHALENPA
jgi:hypothetical protein